jgi:hypothetical protein
MENICIFLYKFKQNILFWVMLIYNICIAIGKDGGIEYECSINACCK